VLLHSWRVKVLCTLLNRQSVGQVFNVPGEAGRKQLPDGEKAIALEL